MPEILSSAENQLNGVGGGPLLVASSETVGSKRQRRPSVRLGDIGGDQPYDSHVRRSPHPHPHPLHLHLHNNGNKHWKLAMKDSNNHSSASGKTSKTRTLFHLSSSETLDGEDKEGNLDGLALSSWKVKDSKKRAFTAKRVRSNWVSKVVDEGDGGAGAGAGAEGDDKYGGGESENIDNGYRDFDVENSESPLKEQSPVHSLENLGLGGHGNERDLIYRRPIRARGVVSEGPHDGVELSGPSDTDWKCGTSGDRNGNNGGEDGVRIWLNGLGLGRYAPVFEIHEVDDEVLPMLTLDDLKDMGINAVGSRRKMYCAIQKLGKGFS